MAEKNPSPNSDAPGAEKATPPRRLLNLTTERKAGLTEPEGKFLYHVIKLQVRNGWQAVSQSDIYASASEPSEIDAGNGLSEHMIGVLGADLQWLKWDDEEKPYLTGGRAEVRDLPLSPKRLQQLAKNKNSPKPRTGKEGYTRNIEVFASLPITVKVAFELQTWRIFRPGHEGRISQDDFVEDFSVRSAINRSDVAKEIDYLHRHQYLYRVDFNTVVYLQPHLRLQLEMEYIKRTHKLFQPAKRHVLAGKWRDHDNSTITIRETPNGFTATYSNGSRAVGRFIDQSVIWFKFNEGPFVGQLSEQRIDWNNDTRWYRI